MTPPRRRVSCRKNTSPETNETSRNVCFLSRNPIRRDKLARSLLTQERLVRHVPAGLNRDTRMVHSPMCTGVGGGLQGVGARVESLSLAVTVPQLLTMLHPMTLQLFEDGT